MKCLHPNIFYPRKIDKQTGRKVSLGYSIAVGCGKCAVCLSARAKKWATQCKYEASLTNQNTHCNLFITLTYSPENLPQNNSLDNDDFTQFVEAVRHSIRPHSVRWFGAGEYGDNFGRPHYHLIYFNFPRKLITKYWRKLGKLYYSAEIPLLSACWQKGFADITISDTLSDYEIKYAVQSHQKGGINYYAFNKVLENFDSTYEKRDGINSELYTVLKSAGKKIEWRNNKGQLRPFRRMSRGLGLKALNTVDTELETPIIIKPDGTIKEFHNWTDPITHIYYHYERNLEKSMNPRPASGNKYYTIKKYVGTKNPQEPDKYKDNSSEYARKSNYNRVFKKRKKEIGDRFKLAWQKSIYDAGLMGLTDSELIEMFCQYDNKKYIKKYSNLLKDAGNDVDQRLTVISMMIAMKNAYIKDNEYRRKSLDWKSETPHKVLGAVKRDYL